ncbi:MAG TPA: M23 family metallopeptidase [Chryseosolibacter sp.]|nr:M23 family metallopeptidase [Chryseosolibacter sp.]
MTKRTISKVQRISKTKLVVVAILLTLITGLLIPQHFSNPVQGADRNSYHHKSFWYSPWGRSGTHKGVDIFAKRGTEVYSSTGGPVLFAGEVKVGGNVVIILGPKWRLHYYAHLDDIHASFMSWTNRKEKIGTVGTTGNAKGKPPHLHYSIATVIPYPWRIDNTAQGWKKLFYLNPIDYLKGQ